jgi:hypothetical protein
MHENGKYILFGLAAIAIGLGLFGLRIATAEREVADTPAPAVADVAPMSVEESLIPPPVEEFSKPVEPAETEHAPPSTVVIEDADAFTADELAFKDLPVDVEIGDYRVSAGQEFEVTVVMSSPALMTFSLHLGYNPDLVEYVADSAEKVGGTFRGDVEFYCKPEMKQMILISTMNPGAKSSTIASRSPVARFRLRAKQAGVTELTILKQGTFYLNADGTQIADFAISGGTILIQ